MPSSVAVEAFCEDEWHRAAAGDGDKTVQPDPTSEPVAPKAPVAAMPAQRIPPWPQRRLNDALAELGPARPQASNPPKDVLPPDDAVPAKTDAGRDRERDAAEPRAAGEAVQPDTGASARVELPPPPRPYTQPPVDLFGIPDTDATTRAWDDSALFEVDPAGAELVRALALADLQFAQSETASSLVVDAHDDEAERERPPMIIERALAEQGLSMMGVLPAAKRANPLPPLAIGFSLSLLTGAALYLLMASG
ncbi:MAG: hypothetical protein AB7L90_04735 [Hyphomicrobiaceae bacterium]